jgi:hypothetical protein
MPDPLNRGVRGEAADPVFVTGSVNGALEVTIEGVVATNALTDAELRATAVPVSAVLTAGEAHVGEVGSPGTTISQTPTITAGAYAAGDAVGGLLTFANAARVSGGGGSAQLSEDAQALLDTMVQMDAMSSRNRPQEELAHGSMYELILENGRFFTPPQGPGVPEDVRAGPKKECYRNTANNVSGEYAYTEGYASVEGLPLAFEHAWLTTKDGRVINPTWTDGRGTAYFGVPLNNRWMWRKVSDSGTWGVLHNYANAPDLLERGLPPEATYGEKAGRFITISDRIVFVGSPGQGSGGTSAGGEAAEQQTLTEEEEVARLASEIYQNAIEHEPALTNFITGFVKDNDGELEGLTHRLKTEESISGKIRRYQEELGVGPTEASLNVADAVRYTVIFDPPESL